MGALLPQLSSDVLVECFSNRQQWLEARRSHDTIGASQAAQALGVAPQAWGTPWALWTSKMAQAQAKDDNANFQRGHKWEPAVLAEYADESGHRLITLEEMFGAKIVILSNKAAPWLRASPDGLAIDQANTLGLVEAKTALNRDVWAPERGIVIERWDDAIEDKLTEVVPPYYAVQGYVQLAASKLPWVDLCALVPQGMWLAGRYVRLMRDEETQQALVEQLGAWRQKHLINGEPPEVDGSKACNQYLAKRFPVPAKKPMRAPTGAELEMMQRLQAVIELEKKAHHEAAVLRNKLIASAEGHRLNVGHPRTDPYGQPQKTGGALLVNLKALRAEAPQLVDRHTSRGAESMTFRLYRFGEEEEIDDVDQ